MSLQLLLIPLALLLENIFEWVFHRYVLHGLGKNPKSFWSFHWKDHHSKSRRSRMMDTDYGTSLFVWNAQTKELSALLAGGVLISPLVYFAPIIFLTFVYTGFRYYYVHRKAHTVPGWAEAHLPWHFDHHMGANQDSNWGVTRPWADHLFKTRIPYFNR